MDKSVRVELDGKKLALTNLDKVLYPATGTTKSEIVDYYRQIAPVMLPHLRNRALTLVRAPDGPDGEVFFEKRCPPHHPEWIREFGPQNNCCVDNTAGLVWLANLAAIELHTLQAAQDNPDQPLGVMFDLDPGPPADLAKCCEVALHLREVLEGLDLQSLCKTSGGEGLHIYIPLHTKTTATKTKEFALAVGHLLAEHFPEDVLTDMKKAKRVGKVFIDWSQNDDAKTTVAPYSLRLGKQPMVSTPITWKDVEQVAEHGDASDLAFDKDAVLARVEKLGDLYEPALHLKQNLPEL